jgi:hypothetical protein
MVGSCLTVKLDGSRCVLLDLVELALELLAVGYRDEAELAPVLNGVELRICRDLSPNDVLICGMSEYCALRGCLLVVGSTDWDIRVLCIGMVEAPDPYTFLRESMSKASDNDGSLASSCFHSKISLLCCSGAVPDLFLGGPLSWFAESTVSAV